MNMIKDNNAIMIIYHSGNDDSSTQSNDIEITRAKAITFYLPTLSKKRGTKYSYLRITYPLAFLFGQQAVVDEQLNWKTKRRIKK